MRRKIAARGTNPGIQGKAAARRTRLGAATALVVLAVFALLAALIAAGTTLPFDAALLLALRRPGELSTAIGPAWLPQVMRDITALGGYAVLTLITVAAAGYLALARMGRTALFLVAAVAGGTMLSDLAKWAFARPRPDLVPHGVDVQTASFPSAHAMMAAVVYLTLGVILARALASRALKTYVIALAALVTLLVGASRVYLGVHWPSDVLAGWAAGTAYALFVWLAMRQLSARGLVRPEKDK